MFRVFSPQSFQELLKWCDNGIPMQEVIGDYRRIRRQNKLIGDVVVVTPVKNFPRISSIGIINDKTIPFPLSKPDDDLNQQRSAGWVQPHDWSRHIVSFLIQC